MRTVHLLLFLFILINFKSKSQTVIEEVKFDNINDQADNFNGMQSLVQIPNNGITGGCLQSPDSNNWGNDNSRYCSKYKAINNTVYKTTTSFYYDSVHPSGFDRAASIWLHPHTDPNHYIITSISHQHKIEISTYGSFNASVFPNTLISGHWYRLEQRFFISNAPSPNSVNFSGKLIDLGNVPVITPPIAIDSIAGFMVDSIFANDDAIEVSITGANYGGGKYLDDFHFEGVKSADSCLTSKINESKKFSDIRINLENNYLIADGQNLKYSNYYIFDSTGKKIIDGRFDSDKNYISISGLSFGIYILSLNDGKDAYRFKFSVVK